MIINFDDDKRHAFGRGFVKGMAAPLMLFAHSAAPAAIRVEQIVPPNATRSVAQALAKDWAIVGNDIRAAIKRDGS